MVARPAIRERVHQERTSRKIPGRYLDRQGAPTCLRETTSHHPRNCQRVLAHPGAAHEPKPRHENRIHLKGERMACYTYNAQSVLDVKIGFFGKWPSWP